ncbi:MAG: 23S rRNA (adenine(2503)-C(2))-methyltransferase RlmN [Methylocystaceae bacterium]
MTGRSELLGLTRDDLTAYLEAMGQPPFRGRQIHSWIYERCEDSFFAMSDLPKSLRHQLDQQARVTFPMVVKNRVSRDSTRKMLLELEDKKRIECVLIPNNQEKNQFTICVSSQVGCPLGCVFCATGQGGYQRNLQLPEILGQILVGERELRKKIKNIDDNIRAITNVVFMGMGEPLANYDNLIEAIHIINDYYGINIGQRHITISTAGIPNKIRELANEGLQVTLAISLHAADDATRSQLMPINRRHGLQDLMTAVDYYIDKTGRRVTFEYILIRGINDQERDAANLVRLCRQRLVNVNLIPYNPVLDLPYESPDPQGVHWFAARLQENGVNAVVRQEHGSDIEAACGQLKALDDRQRTRLSTRRS